MNKQNQWLFEVAPVAELSFYPSQEFFNNPEWEIQEPNLYSSLLGETEWETRETLKLPRDSANRQHFRRQIPRRQAQSVRGNSPQGAKPKPIATIDRFEFGSYLLKKRQFEQLFDLIALLEPLEEGKKFPMLQFAGHTDNVGGESKSNLLLSARRASEIESFIRRRFEKSTPQTRIAVKGAKEPIAANTTENGRSQNRRVEVFSVTAF